MGNNPIRHNIGIARIFDGVAICHSTWKDDLLILQDIWSVTTLSAKTLFVELGRIIQSYSKEHIHHTYFYVADSTLRSPLQDWLEGRLDRFRVRILEPIAPPKDSAVMLAASLEDDLAIVATINRDALEGAFRQIEENEHGRAIGSPLALGLLFGAGEPLFRRRTRQEDQIREHPARIITGKLRDTMRLVEDFATPNYLGF